MPSITICAFCEDPNNPVDTRKAGNYIFVEGWEKIRGSGDGGGHGLTLRTVKEKWAHGDCMKLKMQGIDPQQKGLF